MARIPQTAVASLPPSGVEPSPGTDRDVTDRDMAGLGLPEASPETEAATVLVTVLKNADGSYQVVEGEAPMPIEADVPTAAAAHDADDAATGITVDSVGAALKAVMDILQGDAESEDGLSGQQQFEAGFKGGDTASPPKADAGKRDAVGPRVTP